MVAEIFRTTNKETMGAARSIAMVGLGAGAVFMVARYPDMGAAPCTQCPAHARVA